MKGRSSSRVQYDKYLLFYELFSSIRHRVRRPQATAGGAPLSIMKVADSKLKCILRKLHHRLNSALLINLLDSSVSTAAFSEGTIAN